MAGGLECFSAKLEGRIRKLETDKARHDKMVTLVGRMLELNKQKHGVGAHGMRPGRTPSAPTEIDREIARTDAEIDELVYELCGITDEERKIIEGEE